MIIAIWYKLDGSLVSPDLLPVIQVLACAWVSRLSLTVKMIIAGIYMGMSVVEDTNGISSSDFTG